MSLIKGGQLDRRGFLQTTAAGAAASTLPMGAHSPRPSAAGTCGSPRATARPPTRSTPAPVGKRLHAGARLRHPRPPDRGGRRRQPVPELAESWEASADASVWRFKIRKGVTFHSGKPLTVEDVVASINFHRGEDSTSAAGPIVAADPGHHHRGRRHCRVQARGRQCRLPVHPQRLPPRDLQGRGRQHRLAVGRRLRQLRAQDFSPGVSSEFERNPNHWRDDVAWVDSCEMLSIVDQNARTTALVSGDVHAIDRSTSRPPACWRAGPA